MDGKKAPDAHWKANKQSIKRKKRLRSLKIIYFSETIDWITIEGILEPGWIGDEEHLLRYRAHIEDTGWTDWKHDTEIRWTGEPIRAEYTRKIMELVSYKNRWVNGAEVFLQGILNELDNYQIGRNKIIIEKEEKQIIKEKQWLHKKKKRPWD